jgi:hypothetical protein
MLQDEISLIQAKVNISRGRLAHENEKEEPLAAFQSQAAFEAIATQNSWGSGESISGTGSELEATTTVRQCLGAWIQKYNIKRFADIPCGDANWQGHIPGMESVEYHGFDIAPTAVKTARAKNSQRTNMKFELHDLTSGPPPVKPDLIMVRDVIQHVPFESGVAMLKNAKASGARFLAVSSWQGGGNSAVTPGGMYYADVNKAPFNLPAPIESCENYYGHVQEKADPTHSDHLELIDLNQWIPEPEARPVVPMADGDADDVKDTMSLLDTSGNGKVDKAEMVQYALSQDHSKEDILVLFEELDADRDGELDSLEISDLLAGN